MNVTHHNAPIGIFDSGVGGLTVLNALQTILPQESFVYLADSARIPYGTKGSETIIRYAEQLTAYLITHYQIKALVVACNTATAHALKSLQTQYPQLPIIGVIEPGSHIAVSKTSNQHIAVIATEGTVNSHAYRKAIQCIEPNIKVSEVASPLLVPLVEEGWLNDHITDQIITRYLESLFFNKNSKKPDTLILGCTHFPLLKSDIEACLGNKVTIIDSANTVADYTCQLLKQTKLIATNKEPTQRFLVTDSVKRFLLSADRFLQKPISQHDVLHVDLN